MFYDPWLNRWISLIDERSDGVPVLEIGCGHGHDTATLSSAGLEVVAFDLSPLCVAAARLHAPRARIAVMDVRTQYPDDARGLGVVVASLSLHYFSWSQTVKIVDQIRACLRVGGIFLCRLNSTEDRNFGAGKGREIEKNFYEVNGHRSGFSTQHPLTTSSPRDGARCRRNTCRRLST